MTRAEAIEIYIKASPKVAEMIKKISLWDKNKDLKQNAELLNCSYHSAKGVSMRFNLSYSKNKCGRLSRKRAGDRIAATKILKSFMWDDERIKSLFGLVRNLK